MGHSSRPGEDSRWLDTRDRGGERVQGEGRWMLAYRHAREYLQMVRTFHEWLRVPYIPTVMSSSMLLLHCSLQKSAYSVLSTSCLYLRARDCVRVYLSLLANFRRRLMLLARAGCRRVPVHR